MTAKLRLRLSYEGYDTLAAKATAMALDYSVPDYSPVTSH